MALALPDTAAMPASRRERRQRETIAPLSPTQIKPEPHFSEEEEAFFRAGDLLADEPPSNDH